MNTLEGPSKDKSTRGGDMKPSQKVGGFIQDAIISYNSVTNIVERISGGNIPRLGNPTGYGNPVGDELGYPSPGRNPTRNHIYGDPTLNPVNFQRANPAEFQNADPVGNHVGFQRADPGLGNPPGFQRSDPGPVIPTGYQAGNPSLGNPAGFQRSNPGLGNPAGFQRTDQGLLIPAGFQRPDPGLGNPAGFQRAEPGLVNPAGFQRTGPAGNPAGFQMADPGLVNPAGFQRTGPAGNPAGFQRAGAGGYQRVYRNLGPKPTDQFEYGNPSLNKADFGGSVGYGKPGETLGFLSFEEHLNRRGFNKAHHSDADITDSNDSGINVTNNFYNNRQLPRPIQNSYTRKRNKSLPISPPKVKTPSSASYPSSKLSSPGNLPALRSRYPPPGQGKDQFSTLRINRGKYPSPRPNKRSIKDQFTQIRSIRRNFRQNSNESSAGSSVRSVRFDTRIPNYY